MEALLEKQIQRSYQQTLSFVEQLHQQNLKIVEELDRMNQRMLTRMLELLMEGVDEEDDITKDDGCAEQQPLADAHQVFDESPKRNAQIKLSELVGEGQEKLLEGSKVVAGEPLDVSYTRLEQASVDHLGKGTHKPRLGSGVVIPLVDVKVYREVESKRMVSDDVVDNDSPPWIYTIRHQQGLGSLVFHHPDVCIVVFAETIELDFFKEFQKAGYKVAVAMPNWEELLKDTPTCIFTSGVARLVFDPGGYLLNPYKASCGETQHELL